ncbi:ribonuclease J [Lichenibacterium dinghuense]|uniref:ribonuclease J n=1 Tax=Lichenibacterium dinghuense TaxID=2895977 RepID=UPI001F2EDBFA|nr:ribonuclease J [Lichenibacterium sp. 6Y81]
MDGGEELVFCALGGLGEIGMNAALYGFGAPGKRKYIMVDLGLSFAGPDLPGIDLLLPDLSFVESIRKDLLGLVITHAHEDHIGAVADQWPRLGCRVFATKFAAGLLNAKHASDMSLSKLEVETVQIGGRLKLGPFEVEFVPVAHSIPESCALAIRTPLGTVVHSGDWKIDPTPTMGPPTDAERLTAIGDEGVLALVCDSTNILRDGESPSEKEVAENLHQLIADAPGRVVVTTFASNVSRLRAVADAAQATGRSVIIGGRAMERTIGVARECGYLDGVPPFFSTERYSQLDRKNTVLLATGSQGEPRAALARMAQDDYGDVRLAPGDRVIFSSRTIPGNEREVGKIINGLVAQGVEVITDRTHLVHVSGHPRRTEVAKFYSWVRPKVAVPAHGEPLHLAEHAAFARSLGVHDVVTARNGDMVLLAPGKPAIVDEVRHGQLAKDGHVVVAANDPAIAARTKLAFAGVISIAVCFNSRGEVQGDPDVLMSGLPPRTRDGKGMDVVVDEAIFNTIDNLGRGKRRDPDAAANAIERSVRGAVGHAWGKKPLVHVLIVEA